MFSGDNMIVGEFKRSYLLNIIMISCGLFLIGLFIFFNYSDDKSVFNDFVSGIILGSTIFIGGMIGLLFNFKPSLVIENNRIKGRVGWFQRFDADVSEVDFVTQGLKSVVIHMKNGKRYDVVALENYIEIYYAILEGIQFELNETPKELKTKIEKAKSQNKKEIFFVVFFMIMMFANIFIAAFLTDMKEMYDFNKRDWTAMAIMGAVELMTVAFCLYFATKPYKTALSVKRNEYIIRKTLVEKTPLKTGNVIGVYTDKDRSGRITLFGFPNNNSVYYTWETINANYELVEVHLSEVFESSEELPFETEDFVDITE